MNQRYSGALLLLTVMGCTSAPAFAEVMDKEPTSTEIWIWASILALAGLWACRQHPALGILTLLVTLYSPASMALFELQNPSIGPAILKEAGQAYVRSASAALALVIVCHVAGVSLYVHRRRTCKRAADRAVASQ